MIIGVVRGIKDECVIATQIDDSTNGQSHCPIPSDLLLTAHGE